MRNRGTEEQRNSLYERRFFFVPLFHYSSQKHVSIPLSINVKARRAFTLIEMMVSVTIFSIVVMVGVGALLSLVEANKRAEAINSVMNNLNFAVESMSRSIRVGTTYHCETSSLPPGNPGVLSSAQDCASGGGLLLAFEKSGGDHSNVSDQWVYRLNGTQIERSTDAGTTWIAITAPEVSIDKFQFYVIGSYPTTGSGADTLQPRVLIVIHGTANVPHSTPTTFQLQAAVTQRLLDL